MRLETMRVRHKATNETALARRHMDGTMWVQFNRLDHPHSHGWHLYNRNEFRRR